MHARTGSYLVSKLRSTTNIPEEEYMSIDMIDDDLFIYMYSFKMEN
jgi:hypothetical protein